MSQRSALVTIIVGIISACPAAQGPLGEDPDRGGRLGVGLAAPDPIGATAKLFLSDRGAIDLTIGDDDGHREDLVLQVGYLYHFPDLWSIRKGRLPLYVGLGGRLAFLDGEEHPGHDHDDEDLGFGLRVPVGVAWWTPRLPFEIFAEVAPLFELEPDGDVDLTALVGARYYF